MSSESLFVEPAQEIVPAPPIPVGSCCSKVLSRFQGRRYFRLFGWMFLCVFLLVGWIVWGGWPDPRSEAPPWIPDAIVSLGGGNHERNRESFRAHQNFPAVPIVVSGDSRTIFGFLEGKGVPQSLLHHENHAANTMENARFTKRFLDELKARRVLIVTDNYHAPRALATFRHEQPAREFAVTFEPKAKQPLPTYQSSQRRERLASIWYLLRYGVWSW